MKEAAFQTQVLELATRLGWRTAHFRTARTTDRRGRIRYQTAVAGDGAGFPDLVLVRDRVIFAELKTDTGQLRTEQHDWLKALTNTGVETHVWRPRDWDAIIATLRTTERPK